MTGFDAVPPIYVPGKVFQKVVDGLIKDAIENAPDEGKIGLFIKTRKGYVELAVKNYGVGITEGNQRLIY